MNKNFSLILNAVLLVAVAILYYFHFSVGTAVNPPATATVDSTVASKPKVMLPSEIKASKIVFVNLDVLSEGYLFLKDVSASIQNEQSSLENQYQSKGEKLQADYTDFQDKANKGLYSENQINAEQEKFATRKDELDQLQLKAQALAEKVQIKQEEARKTLTAYVNEYNKTGQYNYILTYSEAPGSPMLLGNDSLDITNDILEGLNAQYKEKKGKK
jgi:outer membrane protein